MAATEQKTRTASLGQQLPRGDPHGVSVSLPRWKDTVGYAKHDPDVLSRLENGYPRFFIHSLVDKLAARLLQWAMKTSTQWDTRPSELSRDETGVRPGLFAMAFPHAHTAWLCVEYLSSLGGVDKEDRSSAPVMTLAFQVDFTGRIEQISCGGCSSMNDPFQSICVAVFPEELLKEAKAFWQHTGFGVSSRHAEYWSANASFLHQETGSEDEKPIMLPSVSDYQDAINTIRQRIASLYTSPSHLVQINDVFLYPCGMSAIASSASAICSLQPDSSQRFQVAVFGFLYVDTFKVFTKVHKFDYKLYGHASASDMDQLERDLRGGMRIHALYTEFPGNPLLGSLNLHHLYALSQEYNFYLVVDDTVGTAINLDLTSFCDVLCTSLTKMFSGSCNVMGGSVTLSPRCRSRDTLRSALMSQYLDTYFPGDVLVLEANSRDFAQRMSVANANAEALADRLRRHPSVAEVFYPKGSPTQYLYDRYKRASVEAGYGFLLSVRFVVPAAAIAFYDALEVAKGPSLGTNFTLSCAYTWLAHAAELEWAAGFGVVEHLVRMSIGVETRQDLEEKVDVALGAAKTASSCRL
ncbi:hypothetical protein E4U13_002260 [Claviceps humidiphila]|uniref:Cystathionine gamma-synthase n=1 Tax=Claviceps humidiphila TaxID=1294629 RepID=A0A9P7Q1R7_9HYPO|nr:hypothetical protein E4U13_002260 [Claviceps humidiphila]